MEFHAGAFLINFQSAVPSWALLVGTALPNGQPAPGHSMTLMVESWASRYKNGPRSGPSLAQYVFTVVSEYGFGLEMAEADDRSNPCLRCVAECHLVKEGRRHALA